MHFHKVLTAVFLIFLLCGLPVFALAQGSKAIDRVAVTQKVVALTFDADMTPKMLHELQTRKVASWYNEAVIDELIAEKVPATLFLTGMWIETYPAAATELSHNPLFEIGNHSYSHPAFSAPCYKLAPIPESEDGYQIAKTDELLSTYAPNHSKLFRFPGLCYDAANLKAVTNAGDTAIGGDVLGGDGFQMSSEKIVSNVVNNVHPGSIIVLHMMGGPNAPKTAEALPVIVKTLEKEGYKFVTVSDLLKLAGKK
jgi:peptidoglycan/xylan/chitin deacetylase (PgdA/CDA1 family)